jgi:hypothetical protein
MRPTQKTLAYLRREGWLAEVTERWNAFAYRRQDLFGFVDIVAIKGDLLWCVQCTSFANVPARMAKILANTNAPHVHNGLSRFVVVMGWRKGDTKNPRVEVYPFARERILD